MLFQVIAICTLLDISDAVFCKRCQSKGSSSNCDDDCFGDFCVHQRWYNVRKEVESRQGCVSGVDRKLMSVGCRRNLFNSTLCICNGDDMCNVAYTEATKVVMPVVCHYAFNEVASIEGMGYVMSRLSCTGHMCFYQEYGLNNPEDQYMKADCGIEPWNIFDVSLSTQWPGPTANPKHCYTLQSSQEAVLYGCACKTKACNSPLKKTNNQYNHWIRMHENVTCYMSEKDENDRSSNNNTCKGQYCMLTKHFIHGRYVFSRGCLSVEKLGKKSLTGHSSVLNDEFWICQEDRCNLDIDSAIVSIMGPPPALLDSKCSHMSAHSTLLFIVTALASGRLIGII